MAHPLESQTVTIEGNTPRRTYAVGFQVNPTVAMDLVSVLAAAGKVLRIRQVTISNAGAQTTPGIVTLQVGYAPALGSGGATPTPGNYGLADDDPASTSTAHTGDTTPAASFVEFVPLHVFVPAAANGGGVDLQFHVNHKPPTVAGDHATAKAFVIRHPGAAGAAQFSGLIEFTEEVE
jgi:hypothetical protein